jgi:hypothetical protein
MVKATARSTIKTSATTRVVGAKDGAMDGTTVGVDDGTPLGSADGTVEWRSVGVPLGGSEVMGAPVGSDVALEGSKVALVGSEVALVGSKVSVCWNIEGLLLGTSEGKSEGINEGIIDGISEGASLSCAEMNGINRTSSNIIFRARDGKDTELRDRFGMVIRLESGTFFEWFYLFDAGSSTVMVLLFSEYKAKRLSKVSNNSEETLSQIGVCGAKSRPNASYNGSNFKFNPLKRKFLQCVIKKNENGGFAFELVTLRVCFALFAAVEDTYYCISNLYLEVVVDTSTVSDGLEKCSTYNEAIDLISPKTHSESVSIHGES